MTPGSPRPENDNSLATGASEAEAARRVDFEPDRSAAPAKDGKPTDREPDVAEKVGTKRRDGERDKDEAPPGAVSPEDLSSESDDGAG